MVSCSGSLVDSRWGEVGALQTDIAVCGEHSHCSSHTGFAPTHGVCFPRLHCSGSRLPYMERALCCVRFQFSGIPQKHGLGCTCICAFPGLSSSGNQAFDGRTLPGCGVPCPLRGLSLSFRRPVRCVRLVSIFGSWPLAATLPANVDHPESHEVFG